MYVVCIMSGKRIYTTSITNQKQCWRLPTVVYRLREPRGITNLNVSAKRKPDCTRISIYKGCCQFRHDSWQHLQQRLGCRLFWDLPPRWTSTVPPRTGTKCRSNEICASATPNKSCPSHLPTLKPAFAAMRTGFHCPTVKKKNMNKLEISISTCMASGGRFRASCCETEKATTGICALDDASHPVLLVK